MNISPEAVKQVAHLARMELKDAELEKLSPQLKDILDFIDQLKKLNISEVEPASHILPINNVLRQDIPGLSLIPDKALENAPRRQEGFFAVPKVIE